MNAQAGVYRTCVGCGGEATTTVAGRLLCDRPGCHQETRNQEQGDQDQVCSKGVDRGLYVVGTPGGSSPERRAKPELYGLIRDYEAGLLEPIDVALGELGPVGSGARSFDGRLTVVTEAMHRAGADIRLLIGLRLAVNEERPLPYSTRLCAQRCGLADHRQASRVLRALERVGVVEVVGTLKPRGKRDGTKLYQPRTKKIATSSRTPADALPDVGQGA